MKRIRTNIPIAAVSVVSLTIACVQYVRYTPDPAKDIGHWISNFKHQRSFEYLYSMKTSTTLVRASGTCVIGQAEKNQVTWFASDGSVIKNEYVGLGDVEYMKKNGDWERSARGEESNIFAQVTRMLDFDKFEYLDDSAPGSYAYRFKANVPFLAPDKWKQMTGTLIISRKTFLPAFIWAGLPDSSAYWQVEIARYNKLGSIDPPVKKWREFAIKSLDTLIAEKKLAGQLKKRLASASIAHRLTVRDSLIIITVREHYNTGDMEELLRTPRVALYRVSGSAETAERIGRLTGDESKPVYMGGPLAGPADIKEAQVRFDRLSRPFLEVVLVKKMEIPGTVCLEIDGAVVAIAALDKPRKMNKITFYIDTMEYSQLDVLKSSISQRLPSLEVRQIFKGTD